MLHYFSEKMFSEVLVSPVKVNQTHFEVHIVSNSKAKMENANVQVSVQRYDSMQSLVPVYQETLFTGG